MCRKDAKYALSKRFFLGGLQLTMRLWFASSRKFVPEWNSTESATGTHRFPRPKGAQ